MSTATEGLPEESGQVDETPAKVGEQPEGSDETPKEEDGWSLKDVPDEVKAHVEKAIKPFQSKYTKAKQEFLAKQKAWEEEKSSLVKREELDRMNSFLERVVKDDDYLALLRKEMGIETTKTDYPDGWDSPEAVTARKLLFGEFAKQMKQDPDMVRALNAANSASHHAFTAAKREADQEIALTKAEIEKEGMPWSEKILNACIQEVAREVNNGKQITLKEAYDSLYSDAIKNYQERQASKVASKKGNKTFQPSNSANKALNADEKLRQVINNLPIKEEEDWA